MSDYRYVELFAKGVGVAAALIKTVKDAWAPQQKSFWTDNAKRRFFSSGEEVASQRSSLALGLLAGGAVAAIATLFLTPKRGKDVRKSLEHAFEFTNPLGSVKSKKIKSPKKKKELSEAVFDKPSSYAKHSLKMAKGKAKPSHAKISATKKKLPS